MTVCVIVIVSVIVYSTFIENLRVDLIIKNRSLMLSLVLLKKTMMQRILVCLIYVNSSKIVNIHP